MNFNNIWSLKSNFQKAKLNILLIFPKKTLFLQFCDRFSKAKKFESRLSTQKKKDQRIKIDEKLEKIIAKKFYL